MTLRPDHWIWGRERPMHHSGAVRMYTRDPDDDGYPRGPNGSPRVCEDCLSMQEYDSASPSGTSWYLSSSNESSPEFGVNVSGMKSTRIINSRFDFKRKFEMKCISVRYFIKISHKKNEKYCTTMKIPQNSYSFIFNLMKNQ